MKLYGDTQSGNCYKIKLLCSLLNIPIDWEHVDILHGGSRTESFLAKNPNGKIPVLELSNGRYLAESNAILHYLAVDSALLPKDPFDLAKVLEWQFFEQYSHEPFIAVARYISKYLGLPDSHRAEYESKQLGGRHALSVMNDQLQNTPFLVGSTLTIADISLYGYTHVAHEGGFDLSPFANVRRWIQAISQHPRYVGMN